MAPMLGPLALATLAWLLLSGAASLAIGATWPAIEPRLRTRSPRDRALAAWLLATAPSWIPGGVVGLCLLPGALAAMGVAPDHCHAHPGHAHLCLAHSAAPLSALSAATLSASIALVLWAALLGGGRLRRRTRALEALTAGAIGSHAEKVTRVESEQPFALCIGVWRPRILLSTGLERRLATRQTEIVLAHEEAHRRRRDALRSWLAGLLSLGHLPGIRTRILAALDLAQEQVCDEEAGKRAGDRLAVAETLLEVERCLRSTPLACSATAAGRAFGAGDTAARVRALVEPEVAAGSRWVWLAGFVSFVAAALSLAGPIHHGMEHLLGELLAWTTRA